MIFLCFSSKDRHAIVESILYHISNFGLPIWYDRYQMLLGDERDYKNFDEGVGSSQYAVIVLSRNAMDSVCACEEIDLIHKKYLEKQIYVFPIFYCIKASELPQNFQWMTRLVYKEIDKGNDSLSACNHIVCKYLLDRLEDYRIKNIDLLCDFCIDKPVYSYISELINSYKEISSDNHDARIAILYAGALFLIHHYAKGTLPEYCTRGIIKLFSDTKLHLPINLREVLIFERLFLLIFNFSIFGNIT